MAFLLALVGGLQGLPAAADGARTGPGQPILSGAEIDYPPFSLVDDNGQATGFSVELLRAALAAMGKEAAFRTGPWAEVRGWLERGEIQALPLVGRTPEREALFDFTIPYITLHGAIVIRKEETGIRDLLDLSGRRVAVMKGDNAEEFLRRTERGIDIFTTATLETALQELSEGRYEAVVAQRLVALRLIQKTGLTDLEVIDQPIEGFQQDFCFGVHEGDRETLALLNEGLALVMADGTYRRLHSKWFATMQLPSDRPLVVGGDRNYPPFEFLDEEGRPAGFNVDLTRAIAREMGLSVEIKLGRWTERLKALETGKIDLLQGMFYSPTRSLQFDFSQTYNLTHHVAAVRRGEGAAPGSIHELAGMRILVEQGDIMHEVALEQGLGKQVVPVNDQEEALRELLEGKYDCALVSRITALYLINKHKWSGLVLGERPILAAEYCYATPKGLKALLAEFSEGLNGLEQSGEYRRIRDKWLGVYKNEHVSLKEALRYTAIVIVPLLLFLLSAVAWSWSMRRQVSQRTRELHESLDRFKHFFESANVGKSITQLSGQINANQALADYLGYTPEELKKKTWQQLTPPEDVPEIERKLARLLKGQKDATRFEQRCLHRNGSNVWADVSVRIRRNSEGKPLYFITTVVDITERKNAEKSLHATEEFLRAMIACSPVALYSVGLDGKVLAWNTSAERIFGWTPEEVVTRPLPIVPPDKVEEFKALRERILLEGGVRGIELLRQRKDGSLFHLRLSASPIRDSFGSIVGIMSTAEDITEQKRSELQIAHLNQVLRAIREINQLIVRERGRDHLIKEGCRLLVANRSYSSALIILERNGEQSSAWSSAGLPPEREKLAAGLAQQHKLRPLCEEAKSPGKVISPHGRKPTCTGCPVRRILGEGQILLAALTHQGESLGYLAVATENRLIVDEEELSLLDELSKDLAYALNVIEIEAENRRSQEEQARLQSQLNHAQKMESLGRLAGGLAHDYNNMLSVITGYAELAMQNVNPKETLYDDLHEILAAARRSSHITRQLLTFARRQSILPEVLDLNASVESTLKMLRRLIGEDIHLSWQPGDGSCPVYMDQSQIDQILANLCLNARDAITGVGRITIETDNLTVDESRCADQSGFKPGRYIMLSVTDDGCGMDERTLENLFEPFFTTKGTGQGTGLGLATVFGIVQQNDGFVNVYSEPGKGSTFRIYLPLCTAHAAPSKPPTAAPIPKARGETVLLVEDEPSILKLAKTMLQELGYNVLEAGSPAEAIQLACADQGGIDLLITDVVMPSMNGQELAHHLESLRPSLQVVFMSGYTAKVIAHRGILDEGVHFLQKPFSFRDLAISVRNALDSR